MPDKHYFLFALLGILMSCQSPESVPPEPSLDLDSPIPEVSLFGPGVISTPLYERDIAISPDQEELIYTLGDYKQNRRALIVKKKKNGEWRPGEVLPISGVHQDIEPFYSPDGKRLYFASNRPIFGDETRSDYNLWYSDKLEGSWSDPVPLDSMINTRDNEFYPSISQNGNLYFTATRSDGVGREDIFRSDWVDGSYQPPVPLPVAINTDVFEFNAFISPEEDYLIFSSFGRADGLGGGDLYISEKDANGKWQVARNLGPEINSDKLDYCPFVDAAARHFYFTSEKAPPSTERIGTVEALQQNANQVENGFGNIYWVDFTALHQQTK